MAKTREVIEWGENIGWCRPYVSDDGKNALAVNEVEVVGMLLNGKDIDCPDDADTLRQFAQSVNKYYTDYSGWSDLHIALEGDIRECGCRECPWFDICEAMDAEEGE